MHEKQLYNNQISLAQQAFRAAGIDASTTVGDAIAYFTSKNGFKPPKGRVNFHEAMHLASNLLNGRLTSEWKVAFHEAVFCRGQFHLQNPNDTEDYEQAEPILDFETSFILADSRIALINTKYRDVDINNREEAAEEYQKALELNDFFCQLSGGRALYQLTTQELLEIPLVLLGVEPAKDFLVDGIIPLTADKKGAVIQQLKL